MAILNGKSKFLGRMKIKLILLSRVFCRSAFLEELTRAQNIYLLYGGSVRYKGGFESQTCFLGFAKPPKTVYFRGFLGGSGGGSKMTFFWHFLTIFDKNHKKMTKKGFWALAPPKSKMSKKVKKTVCRPLFWHFLWKFCKSFAEKVKHVRNKSGVRGLSRRGDVCGEN